MPPAAGLQRTPSASFVASHARSRQRCVQQQSRPDARLRPQIFCSHSPTGKPFGRTAEGHYVRSWGGPSESARNLQSASLRLQRSPSTTTADRAVFMHSSPGRAPPQVGTRRLQYIVAVTSGTSSHGTARCFHSRSTPRDSQGRVHPSVFARRRPTSPGRPAAPATAARRAVARPSPSRVTAPSSPRARECRSPPGGTNRRIRSARRQPVRRW